MLASADARRLAWARRFWAERPGRSRRPRATARRVPPRRSLDWRGM